MKVDVSKLHKNFLKYLNLVQSGRDIIIMQNDKTVAKLTAVISNDITDFFGMWSDKNKNGVDIVNTMRAL